MKEYVKIYGAPRSGTNHMRFVLKDNFQDVIAYTDVLGFRQWPHPVEVNWEGQDWSMRQNIAAKKKTIKGHVKLVTPDLKKAFKEGRVKYLVTARHPCACYLSRMKKRFKRREMKKALHPVGVFWFCLYWNSIHWNWINQVIRRLPEKSILVKHEDVVSDFQNEMSKIGRKFGWKAQHPQFRTPSRKLHPSGLDTSPGPLYEKRGYDPQYDSKYKFLQELPQPIRTEFQTYLDQELMKFLGYSL